MKLRMRSALLAVFAVMVPLLFAAPAEWLSVSSFYDHSAAIAADSTLWSWGRNHSGELGIGTTSERWDPVPVKSSKKWIAVEVGMYFTLAIAADSTL